MARVTYSAYHILTTQQPWARSEIFPPDQTDSKSKAELLTRLTFVCVSDCAGQSDDDNITPAVLVLIKSAQNERSDIFPYEITLHSESRWFTEVHAKNLRSEIKYQSSPSEVSVVFKKFANSRLLQFKTPNNTPEDSVRRRNSSKTILRLAFPGSSSVHSFTPRCEIKVPFLLTLE